jgi:hypothetical protein
MSIYGLPWRHPAVVLNAISGIFFAVYFVEAIVILHIPPGRTPFAISVAGAAFMCCCAVWGVSESDKATVRVGYLLTALNIFTSCGHILIVLSYLTGQNSRLWRMMN